MRERIEHIESTHPPNAQPPNVLTHCQQHGHAVAAQQPAECEVGDPTLWRAPDQIRCQTEYAARVEDDRVRLFDFHNLHLEVGEATFACD